MNLISQFIFVVELLNWWKRKKNLSSQHFENKSEIFTTAVCKRCLFRLNAATHTGQNNRLYIHIHRLLPFQLRNWPKERLRQTKSAPPHTHTLSMRSLLIILAAICLLFIDVTAACEVGSCSPFTLTNLAGDFTNYSYATNWTIAKRMNGPTPEDTAACRDTALNADGSWTSTCSWSLNCSAYNGSVVFRKLHVRLREGSTVEVSNFSIWNYNVLSTPLVSISNLFIPRDSYSPREYTYAPDTLITGSSSHNAVVSITVKSLTGEVPTTDSVVDVHLNFTCSRIYRYVFVELNPDLPNDGSFWSIFAAYILPGIMTAIIIIIALLRYCSPDLTMSLKKWAGFKELDDEARTRHAKIKDRAGGGTWHDHAAEVVSDLQNNKIDETHARNEIHQSDEEIEMGSFKPAKTPVKAPVNKGSVPAAKPSIAAPTRPKKEVSSDSIDIDDDAPTNIKPQSAPPPAQPPAPNSDEDLDFSDSDEDKKKDIDSDDDVL